MAMSAAQQGASAAAKLLRDFRGDESQPADNCPKHQESRHGSAHAEDYSIARADFLSRKLVRCWKRFVQSKNTTLALARAYDCLGINMDSVKDMPFESLVTSMQSPALLQAAKALLHRLETRLVTGSASSPVDNIDHLLKHLATTCPPRRKAPPRSRRGAAKKIASSATSPSTTTTTSGLARYSPRVVLCAYMIVAYPDAVLSGQGEGEKELKESAAIVVRELELLVKVILDGPAGQTVKAQLVSFDKAWCAYLYGFVPWKVKDARVMEDDLVRAACKLEVSMMQACKVAGDGEGELTHDMMAIRDQVAADQSLLREKVRQLTGGAGVERMNAAVADARSEFLEAKKSGGPAAAPVANVSTPLSVGSPPPAAAKEVTENEQMVSDILHQGVGGDLFGAGGSTDFEKRVKEQMEKAFWDIATESMTGDKPDYSMLVNLVTEVRSSLHEVSPKKLKDEIVEKIDIEILSQVLGSGSQEQAVQYLAQILKYSLGMVLMLSAAAKEDDMKKSHEKLLSELAASSEIVSDNGVGSFAIAVSKGLRFVLEEIRELRSEINKVHIQMETQTIVGGGLEYLQQAFADRYGLPANASAALPLTLQFVSSSKSVAEQEWREHSEALSALPSAGHAPGIIPVLRAGHGAPVGQLPSSLGQAASDSGQPECKGERLDKIVRIGLLQLVTNMEELKMQSTPETFQLNLQRLKAVQCQFQQVIVIATSMLILRQVLMGENPKPTPAELESAISQLFEALVKTLDIVKTVEEIVAVMICASATVGSPSEEKVQARKQVMARVFVKSVQPGDAVSKMVSRAIHCAFRGVVLGGSGANGRKLADAALRRVGAARLADKVVKAAEVVIKVSTLSEKVHGPWYKALI
ncbi:unnamed protein product [Urochloa humidicola]